MAGKKEISLKELAQRAQFEVTQDREMSVYVDINEKNIRGQKTEVGITYTFSSVYHTKKMEYDYDEDEDLPERSRKDLEFFLEDLVVAKISSTKDNSVEILVYDETNDLIEEGKQFLERNRKAKSIGERVSFYRRCVEEDIVPTDPHDRECYDIGEEFS